MSKADHDWTITISGRGPCQRGVPKDPDQLMLQLAERLEKSGQSIEITDFTAIPLTPHEGLAEPPQPEFSRPTSKRKKPR